MELEPVLLAEILHTLANMIAELKTASFVGSVHVDRGTFEYPDDTGLRIIEHDGTYSLSIDMHTPKHGYALKLEYYDEVRDKLFADWSNQ